MTEKKRNKNRRKPQLKADDADTQSESDAEDSASRPKRDKPSGTMSDIERAKIKNLPADLKFQVKKRSKKDPFIIEFLKEKKGNTYLVKWENRHENENSWEPRSKIPSDVLQYYEQDLRRLGTQVPVLSSPRDLEMREKSKVKSAEVKESKTTESYPEKENQTGSSLEQNELKADHRSQETETEMEEIGLNAGEYIEQPFEEIFDAINVQNNTTDSSIIKEEEVKRKSKRDPKPKILSNEFIGEREKSKKVKQEKPIQEELESNSSLVRKSNREPKPKKFMDQTDLENHKQVKSGKNQPAKKKNPVSDAKPKAKTYIIESLVERKGEKYLVKWESYPPEQNTWEPRANIPKFITQFYEQDPARLGMPAPDVS